MTDHDPCGAPTRAGPECSRPATEPDGRCWQHTEDVRDEPEHWGWSEKVGPRAKRVTAEVKERFKPGRTPPPVRLRYRDPASGKTRVQNLRKGGREDGRLLRVHNEDGDFLYGAAADAVRQAKDLHHRLYGHLPRARENTRPEDTTVGELLDAFMRRTRTGQLPVQGEVTPGRVRDLERTCEMWGRVLGRDTEAMAVNGATWSAFIQDRLSGRVDPRGRRAGEPDFRDTGGVTAPTVNTDLADLKYVYKVGVGMDLLPENKVRSYPLAKDHRDQGSQDGKRPPIFQEDHETLLEAADRVRTYVARVGGPPELMERAWLREVLILAHETGRRLGALRHLRVDDWNPSRFRHGGLRFRKEWDKAGLPTAWVPVTEACAEAVETQVERLSASEVARRFHTEYGGTLVRDEPTSEWLFPKPSDPADPLPGKRADDWFKQAERKAGLWEDPDARAAHGLDEDEDRPHLYGFHGYRVKFATELLALESNPPAYVAHLGGWKTKDMEAGSTSVMIATYQRASLDADRLVEVLGNRGTLRRPA